jgi:hypothetical protein
MYEKHLDNPAISPNNPLLHGKPNRKRKEPKTVRCVICGQQCLLKNAHLHSGDDGDEWIGDECCWDDRLHASE